MILILQIAAGIVLGVLILAYWQRIVTIAVPAIAIAAIIFVLGIAGMWLWDQPGGPVLSSLALVTCVVWGINLFANHAITSGNNKTARIAVILILTLIVAAEIFAWEYPNAFWPINVILLLGILAGVEQELTKQGTFKKFRTNVSDWIKERF